MGSFHSGLETAVGEGRCKKKEGGGGSGILNATRVATIVACKINCVTDQKKKAKAKPRKEMKGKKTEKKHIFSFWTNKKFASYARVKWGEGEGGKHFCRQFAEGRDSTLYICWGTNNARRTCN